MEFTLQQTDNGSSARAGIIKTDHGEIRTPIFMPVGTAGTVKGIKQKELENEINADVILGNTYHLYLRPGIDVIHKAGGLHKFIGWDRNILTDSGGYQVFSLSQNRKLTEEGAIFQSHIDGSRHLFSPESVMEIQRMIGADIIMAFDECTPYPCEKNYASNSMDMTHRWLDRCIRAFDESEPLYGYKQILAPIVQGSTYPDLRKQSAEYISSKDREINAIGGLSVGEPAEEMYEATHAVCNILPKHKPRYLMGVGTPENILECISLGIDMFDCVLPTRNARHGLLYTSHGTVNIRNEKWKKDYSPIDDQSSSEVSRIHSKAYLRHLIVSKEMLGAQICTLQNLTFYLSLVRTARDKILSNEFVNWKNEILPKISQRI